MWIQEKFSHRYLSHSSMGPHSIPNEKKGNLTGMVLLDLLKAFDTENHGMFLMKLDAIGLNADSLR